MTASTSWKKCRSAWATWQVTGSAPSAEHHAHRRNVGAPVDTQWRVAVAEIAHRPRRIAVEEALHVRQEAHELAIVPLLEGIALDAELVIDESPVLGAKALEQRVGAFAAAAGRRGNKLNRPKHDLAEMANDPSFSLAGV